MRDWSPRMRKWTRRCCYTGKRQMRIGYNRTTGSDKYGAVILAAGLSSRMNDFKPLLYVDGRTAIAGLVETLRGAGIEDIVVVTGHERDRLATELEQLRVLEAFNENYEDGMFTSIKAGLAKARESWPDKAGFMLLPVDHPIVSIETIRAVSAATLDVEGEPFAVPTFEGKKGHPLLIPTSRIDEILAYDGPKGLKGITDKDPETMIRVPVTDEGCVMDMDTPEGYKQIVAFVQKGFRRDKLSVLAGRKRIILVRHGQTRQHEEPMFIGQYDVPLSDEGRTQAVEAAEKIAEIIEPDVQEAAGWVEGVSIGKEPLPPLENIWCSDLKRAKETAEIIAGKIRENYGPNAVHENEGLVEGVDPLGMFPASGRMELDPTVTAIEEMREISLGEWDGRPIDEIRREYPEEYERRGEDLFTFKTGNHSENLYDLQYRVIGALRKLLASDDGRNIIIVAHSGVIRAIENNLKGLRIDDDWEPVAKGDIRIWESPPVP